MIWSPVAAVPTGPRAALCEDDLDFLALQELGRIERTLFMLDWLESPQLRQLCHAGLNKREQRHALAQVICTFKQGRIADRGPDAQQFRASSRPDHRRCRIAPPMCVMRHWRPGLAEEAGATAP